MKYAGIVFLYLLFSCSNDNDKEYTSIGRFDKDSLETGIWKFKDKTGAVIEEGEFEKGIRLGKWRYNLKPIDSINWELYSNTNNSIKTNVPDFLKVIEQSDSIVVLKPIDTTQIFNLVIGNGFYIQTKSLEKYRVDLFQDLDARDIKINDSINYYIQTKTGTLLYTYISASDPTGSSFSYLI